jgi:DNA-binding NarL/FixJ family response regulator
MLRGIISLFEDDQAFSIVGQAADASSTQEVVATTQPQVLLLDFSMPGDVPGLIGWIAREHPDTRVIVFTAFASLDSAVKAIEAGASGFLLKGGPCDEILAAVTAVAAGQIYIVQQYAGQVMAGLRQRSRQRSIQQSIRLSVRERQIVGQLLNARTNREIAESLHLSEKTVKHYMSGLMSKLNARNRVEVVLAAKNFGAVD